MDGLIMTARDVRYLTICTACRKFADRRHSVGSKADGYMHGRCYIKKHGAKALLALPKAVTDHLCLGDIGVHAMRMLLNRR